MLYLAYFLLLIYAVCLLGILIYSVGVLHLLWGFWRNRKFFCQTLPPLIGNEVPFITIQLPIYNEKYVIERLIDAIAAQDYPLNCFCIQILDDSRDETVEIVAKKVAELKAKGYDIEHVRRKIRKGFKAGALADAFDLIKTNAASVTPWQLSEDGFLAIFDADFVPRPDFLRNMVPYLLADERIAMIQTRWEHINRNYSLFTQIQAFHLDAHFAIEQFVRCKADYCMNFNGTAGIWRKAAIADAGGWQADTITEDLDLSYRTRLKGWKLAYLDAVGAPAELPITMGAIKSQQFRWMKGGAEVARKMLKSVWQSDWTFAAKWHGTHHLLGSSIFLLSLTSGILSGPISYFAHIFPQELNPILAYSPLFMFSFVSLSSFYFTASYLREQSVVQALKRIFTIFIPFLTVIMGLSFHNAQAAYLGLRGKKSPFIRTPKFNVTDKKDTWHNNQYTAAKMSLTAYFECLLVLYFGIWSGYCIYIQQFSLLPFQLMLFIGYTVVVIYTWWQRG